MPRSETVPDVAAAAPREDHRTRPGGAVMRWIWPSSSDHRRDRPLGLRGAEHGAGGRARQGEQGLALPPVAEQGRAGHGRHLRPAARSGRRGRHRQPARDLLALFRSAAELLAGPGGAAIRGLISDALRDPELAAQLRRYTRGRSVAAMREVVQRAMERGELPPGTITARQLEAGLSVMRFHFLTHGGPVPDHVIVEIVDEVMLPLLHAAAGRETS